MVDAGGSSWHESNRGVSCYLAIYFALFVFTMVLAKWLHDRPKLASFIPEAAMIILVGIIVGFLFNLAGGNNEEEEAVDGEEGQLGMADSVLSFSPTVFFVVLLPPIIFNSGYHLRRDLFFRHIAPIFLFACIGTAVASGIFATFLYLVRNVYPGFEPSFLELMTFGALISATDPVSTLAVFQAKQVDPHLFYLVFGESVINDAVGLVLFEALAHLVEKYSEESDLGAEFSQFLFDFAMGFVGSTILGILCGMVSGWFFKVMDFRHTPFLELCIYVPIMYIPFILAEIARLSGIVTVLFAGITAKRYIEPNLSRSTREQAATIFKLTAHLTETIIFLELGLSVFGLSGDNYHWGFISMSLVGCLISRFCNIYPMTLIYNCFCGQSPTSKEKNDAAESSQRAASLGYEDGEGNTSELAEIDDRKIPMKTAHMLFFSGLRGAVSYALVRTFPQTGNELEFTCTCMVIVLITTFVLGGTTELTLKCLGIEMGVNEEDYLKRLSRRRLLKGPLRRFEAYTIRKWVIRDFEKKMESKDPELEEDDTFEDESEDDDQIYNQYVEQSCVEMTEVDHKEKVVQKRKKRSVFEFGKR